MVEWSFNTADAHAARETRHDFVARLHRVYGDDVDLTAAEVVLGELIGNVVRYAPGRACVCVEFDDCGLTIAVKDHGNGFVPTQPHPETNALRESGRGLAIIATLAETVEVEKDADDGFCVRARLGLNLRRKRALL